MVRKECIVRNNRFVTGIMVTGEKRPFPFGMIIMITGLWFSFGCVSLQKVTASRAEYSDNPAFRYYTSGTSFQPVQYHRKDGGVTVINPIVVPRSFSCKQAKAAFVFSALIPHPSQTLGAECTAIFQKAFLKQRVFKVTQRFSAQEGPEEALMDQAGEKGFDLLVRGRITDFFLPRGPKHPVSRCPSRSTI
ncbi:MAG: hypothetical protein AB1847_08755 [bacterium]